MKRGQFYIFLFIIVHLFNIAPSFLVSLLLSLLSLLFFFLATVFIISSRITVGDILKRKQLCE